MLTQVSGRFGPVVVARLDPHADILSCIREIVRSNNMKSGVVLSITGALEHAVLQRFEEGADNTSAIGVVEIEGPMESSGTGIVGIIDAPQRGDVPFSVGGYRHGEPYAHIHLTVTTAKETLVGHVMEGCRVRSNHPVSHFTIMVAPIEDVSLKLTIDGLPEAGKRGVYHLLESA
jgi:predicted DNA-binding protein with PD1-like motif